MDAWFHSLRALTGDTGKAYTVTFLRRGSWLPGPGPFFAALITACSRLFVFTVI